MNTSGLRSVRSLNKREYYRKRRNKGSFKKKRRKIKERCNYTCQKCMNQYNSRFLSAHHIQKVSDGGTDSIQNLVCLCLQCHEIWHKEYEGKVDWDKWFSIKRVPYRYNIKDWT